MELEVEVEEVEEAGEGRVISIVQVRVSGDRERRSIKLPPRCTFWLSFAFGTFPSGKATPDREIEIACRAAQRLAASLPACLLGAALFN